MKVVLKQDIKGTGKKDQMVEVSDGYARNYLFPRKLAVAADAANANEAKNKAEAKQYHLEQERAAAQRLADAVNAKGVTIHAKAGTNGRLFGAVTAKEISAEIKNQYKMDVDKKKISVSQDIKGYGVFSAEVKFHAGVVAEIKVEVVEG